MQIMVGFGTGLRLAACGLQRGEFTEWSGPYSSGLVRYAQLAEDWAGRRLAGEELLVEVLSAMQHFHRVGQPVGMLAGHAGRGGVH